MFVKMIGLMCLGALSGLASCDEDREEAPEAASAKTAAPNREAAPCTDLSGLTPDQIALRDTFGYVDRSDAPDLVCRTCEFWTEPPSGELCGGCTLMAGPIHPEGFCDSYSEA